MEKFATLSEAKEIYNRGLYLLLTDAEAQEQARSIIIETAWAFEPEFLSMMTGLDESVFIILQKLCETSNEAVLNLIKATCGLDKFVSEAILADGRGHFISPIDGQEIELQIAGVSYFAYYVD